MVMPVMGGAELVQKLRSLNPWVKILILTGYPLDEKRDKELMDKIEGWIPKPVVLENFAEQVKKVLG